MRGAFIEIFESNIGYAESMKNFDAISKSLIG